VRVVGVDLGERRVGVAVSDGGGVLASPWCTIERSGDAGADHRALGHVVRDVGAGLVVVGLPLSLDGRRGPAARAVEDEVRALEGVLAPMGVAVEVFDERFTTVSAARSLAASGHRGRDRRGRIDKAAAAVMLQAWLDAHGATAGERRGTGGG